MPSIKLGGLALVISFILGGLIVAWAWGLEWLTGIGVVVVLLIGLFVSLMVAVFLPIGNMIIKGMVFVVLFALIILYGLRYLGVL